MSDVQYTIVSLLVFVVVSVVDIADHVAIFLITWLLVVMLSSARYKLINKSMDFCQAARTSSTTTLEPHTGSRRLLTIPSCLRDTNAASIPEQVIEIRIGLVF